MKKQIIAIISFILVVAMCAAVLAACVPNSKPSNAKENLSKNGYTVSEPKGLSLLSSGALTVVTGIKSEEDKPTEGIVIIYYEDSDSAKKAFETIKEKAGAIRSLLGVSDEDEDNRWSFKRSGRTIWYGTSAGVRAAS